MDVYEAKKQVIEAGKELWREGFIARTWGNISCKTDENHFVISASGREYETLTEEEVVELDLNTLSHEGDIKPSSEKRVHAEIYKLKEDVGFIIHTHQHNASAVSAMGLHRVKFDKEYPGLGEFVLCSEYGLPSTSRVSDKVAEAVRDSIGNAVIMSNHGAVCYGKTREEAFEVVRNLEEACGKFLDFMGVDPWQGEESHFVKEWNDDPVIMAAGAFVSGSSIELSADGPIKPPYNVYFQGGLTWPHAKLGILKTVQNLLDRGLIVLP